MEDKIYCTLHRKRPAEYVCASCNLSMCESCNQVHINDAVHWPESCKEVGCALMHKRIQEADGKQQTKELAKLLRKTMKELEAGLLREIDKLQFNSELPKELCEMQKLEHEERYAELYFLVKGLDANNETTMRELGKRLMDTVDTASDTLKKVQSMIIALATRVIPQHKPMLTAYKRDEVYSIMPDSYAATADYVLSALDSDKYKAMFIWPLFRIGDEGATALASALQTHPVSAFFLFDNNISDIGAESLAKAAFRHDRITMFCLDSNIITDAGAKAVAEAVRNCPSLNTFYISSLAISDPGAKTLANAMKGCPLSVFGLVGDKISDAGAIAAAEIISSCAGTLCTFFLGSSRISAAGAKKVTNVVSKRCRAITEFYLGSEPLSGEALTYILEAMAGISSIRSVNIYIGGDVSKEHMDSCLTKLQQSEAGKLLKLRISCEGDNAKSVCGKCVTEWNGKFVEFQIVEHIGHIFVKEVILGDDIPLSKWRCLIF